MRATQKKFLLVAIPFFVATIGVSFVSLRASTAIACTGLAIFGYFALRPMGRSLAHATCGFCSRMIIYEHEGEFCKQCNAPIHAKCMDEHVMSHATPPTTPFR